MDSLVKFFALLIVVVPVIILIAGVILYFLYPSHRMITGIVLTTLGGIGLLIFLGVLFIAIRTETLTIIIFPIVGVELVTLILGIISLIGFRTKAKNT